MDTLNKIVGSFWTVIKGLSRFVGLAAPIAGAVGEAIGNNDVKDAADQAKQVADLAQEATKDEP